MKLISHRGNLNGRDPDNENSIEYIKNALSYGFDVEIDIFYYNERLWLGHDEPSYLIKDINFLKNDKLWCHAKNLQALEILISDKEIHSFWHQKDDVTLTSRGYIWTYPDIQPLKNAILVVEKKIEKKNLPECLGICSDYVGDIT
jgi:hypothetical protein